MARLLPALLALSASSASSPVNSSCLLQSLSTHANTLFAGVEAPPAPSPPAAPRTLLWNGTALARLRRLCLDGKAPDWVVAPLEDLKARASERLGLPANLRPGVPAGPWSPVHQNPVEPPDGDLRSFVSYRSYAWPCFYGCEKAKAMQATARNCSRWVKSKEKCGQDGLPYVEHDGFANPFAAADSEAMRVMAETLELFTLAWWFSGEGKYGEAAMKVLGAWFLENSTRMSPHMAYAGLVPGKPEVKPSPFPAALHFRSRLTDCVALLQQEEKVWSKEVQQAWDGWLQEWLQWWTTSEAGVANAQAPDHQGTWHHVHKLAVAHALGRDDLSRGIIEQMREQLPCAFVRQIGPDGEMHNEARRVTGVSMSLLNLEGLLSLSVMEQTICSAAYCQHHLPWDEESKPPPLGTGTWANSTGWSAKCHVLGSTHEDTAERCLHTCLTKVAGCDSVATKPDFNRVACRFKQCGKKGFKVEVMEDWTLHSYRGTFVPGRGSVEKAWTYLERYTRTLLEWLGRHPNTDVADLKKGSWPRLARLARVVASSFAGEADLYEAKVEESFRGSWESLIFPPPSFVHS